MAFAQILPFYSTKTFTVVNVMLLNGMASQDGFPCLRH